MVLHAYKPISDYVKLIAPEKQQVINEFVLEFQQKCDGCATLKIFISTQQCVQSETPKQHHIGNRFKKKKKNMNNKKKKNN